MNLADLGIITRPFALDSDVSFVGSRWASGVLTVGLRDAYKTAGRAAVDSLIAASRIAVVCSKTSLTTLHAFAAVDRATGALNYAYVVPKLRGHGLARIAITAALDGYPERIQCAMSWPRPSSRYHPARTAERKTDHV